MGVHFFVLGLSIPASTAATSISGRQLTVPNTRRVTDSLDGADRGTVDSKGAAPTSPEDAGRHSVPAVVSTMAGWRERDADKQVRARRINEWIEHESTDGTGSLRCECRDPHCESVLMVTRQEYEAVRAFATRFVVAPNHENPETERIVEENDRFAVVESVTGEGAKRARRSYGR